MSQGPYRTPDPSELEALEQTLRQVSVQNLSVTFQDNGDVAVSLLLRARRWA